MCGIARLVALAPTACRRRHSRDDAPRAWSARCSHRGPDEFGALPRRARAGLGHARLSIIDLATGAAAAVERGRLARGSSSTARSSTTWSCAPSCAALGHRFRTHERHRGHRPRLGGSGARAPSRGSTGSSPSPCGTPPRGTLVLARDRLGVRPLHLCEHAGRLYFASEVKAIFAADPLDPPRVRPGGPRRDLHLLERPVAPQDAVRRRHASSSRATSGRISAAERVTERAFWRPRYPLDGEREGASAGTLGEADGGACAAARRGDRACGCSAPTCRWGATSPAGSTARSSPRWRAGRTALEFSHLLAPVRGRRVRRDARSSGSWPRSLGTRAPRGRRSRRADIARRLPRRRRSTPSARCCAPRRRRCSCCRGWSTTRASRSSSPARAPTRCSPATTSSARAKVRRFWARQPGLAHAAAPARAALPVPRALAGGAAGHGAAVLRARPRPRRRSPGFSHDTRWRRGGGAAATLLGRAAARAPPARDVTRAAPRRPAGRVPRAGRRSPRTSTWRCAPCSPATSSRPRATGCSWPTRSRAASLSSTRDVVDARELPAGRPTSCAVLDEKHVLKRAAARPGAGRDPRAQEAALPRPGRARRSAARARPTGSTSARPRSAVSDAGVFDPDAVGVALEEVPGASGEEQFSNADNMALVGVLSTQLLWDRLLRRPGAARRRARGRSSTGSGNGPREAATMNDAVPLLHDFLHALRSAGLPDKVAASCRGRSPHLRARSTSESNALAHALAAPRRRTRGDRVVVFADNTLEAAVAFFGVLKANAVGLHRQPTHQGRQARLPAERLPAPRRSSPTAH